MNYKTLLALTMIPTYPDPDLSEVPKQNYEALNIRISFIGHVRLVTL